MGAVYRQRLTPADVGRRVSVRRWHYPSEGGPVAADVVGRLVAWSAEGTLTIRRRGGEHVEVALDDVLAARAIPEHPRLPPE